MIFQSLSRKVCFSKYDDQALQQKSFGISKVPSVITVLNRLLVHIAYSSSVKSNSKFDIWRNIIIARMYKIEPDADFMLTITVQNLDATSFADGFDEDIGRTTMDRM